MKRKRKTKERRPTKAVDEGENAGVSRFLNLAFRKAVEATGKVVVVKMERRWCKNRHRSNTSACR
jgi:hypothetical protein